MTARFIAAYNFICNEIFDAWLQFASLWRCCYRTFEPLEEQSFASRATKWANLLPNSPRYYTFFFFFRKFMSVCGINSRAIQRQRNVIFWGDFCIKVKLVATLSFFTAVVHPIVVSASLCTSFLHIFRRSVWWLIEVHVYRTLYHDRMSS